jgi:hypothetical protein
VISSQWCVVTTFDSLTLEAASLVAQYAVPAVEFAGGQKKVALARVVGREVEVEEQLPVSLAWIRFHWRYLCLQD